MISSTLNQYKESFKTNLLTFLNEYEDNTKTFFLQNEKVKYQAYQNALIKIADQMKFFTSEELKKNLVHKSIAADFKKINPQAYNAIITELHPTKTDDILSLSAINKDRIHINETELEKHIKSSIVILKFIADQNEISNDISKPTYTDESGETGLKQKTNGQLDSALDKWLKNYEANFEYLSIPLIIEEKPGYVTDSYYNYEERYFDFQIDVCNTILRTVPNNNTILNYKKKFQQDIIDLRKQFPIPGTNIETIISDINNAFFRLEKFMDGSVSTYQSFLFNDYFTLFFNELNKIENITVKNHSLRDGYHYLLSQIDYAHDKSEFKNHDAYENDDFNRDCNEIGYIHFNRSSEFGINVDIDDYRFEMPSIIEIVNDATNTSFNAFNQSTDINLKTSKTTPNLNEKHTSPVSNNYKKLIEKFTDSYENLIDDPLLNPENEYIVLNKDLELERISKAIGNSNNGLFVTYTYEPGFEEWEKNQHLEIGKSFSKLVKELNLNKIFFFGCSFDNYDHNYDKRLKFFLEDFYDATESDFVEGELEFLENILSDIQNSEGAHDGYSVSGYSNFSKAYDIISRIGYKQYFFSHNKKEAFLNKKKYELTQQDKLKESVPLDNHQDKVEQEKPKTFELSKKLKKKLRFINISESEQKELDKLDIEKVDDNQNDLLKSTIEDYLDEFRDEINGDGYDILVNALNEYFSSGSFPVLTSKINFKRINKKRVGWALKELYKSEKTDNLNIEYFRFAKDNINLFANEDIVEDGFKKSNFYKAFTTNVAK